LQKKCLKLKKIKRPLLKRKGISLKPPLRKYEIMPRKKKLLIPLCLITGLSKRPLSAKMMSWK